MRSFPWNRERTMAHKIHAVEQLRSFRDFRKKKKRKRKNTKQRRKTEREGGKRKRERKEKGKREKEKEKKKEKENEVQSCSVQSVAWMVIEVSKAPWPVSILFNSRRLFFDNIETRRAAAVGHKSEAVTRSNNPFDRSAARRALKARNSDFF